MKRHSVALALPVLLFVLVVTAPQLLAAGPTRRVEEVTVSCRSSLALSAVSSFVRV
jgi:hypothetical protein